MCSPIPITVCRGTCNEREVLRANGRVAAGSAAGFYVIYYFPEIVFSDTVDRVYGGIMAIGDKIRQYFDKGVAASKTAFDKGMEASKSAITKASSAVQDFSDKSVVRIEKHQFETKKEEQLLALGKKVFEKFSADSAASIHGGDADIAPIVAEVKHCDEEIAKRDTALAQKAKQD